MQIKLHKNAKTTPATRKYISENSRKPVSELMQELGLSRNTINRWKNRTNFHDKSSRPNNFITKLEDWQEQIVVELRKTLLLSLDDLWYITMQYIDETISRNALYTCLKRHNVSKLTDIVPQEQIDKKHKPFKNYDPGYIHIDIKYLPKMPDEKKHSYLFVAIDRASRWVFIKVFPDKTAESASDFLQETMKVFKGKIHKILTDNGKEFTDRFARNRKSPSGLHKFDLLCDKNKIDHRLTKPYTPKTNGMVERFNRRIKDLLKGNRVGNIKELENLLLSYRETYNNRIKQRTLKWKTPSEVLCEKLQINQPNLLEHNNKQFIP
ncbi:MAG: IS481 family transposase [Mesoflavibacter sp.]|nr:IS481 family transposase [Mesoflavibacter sp.]